MGGNKLGIRSIVGEQHVSMISSKPPSEGLLATAMGGSGPTAAVFELSDAHFERNGNPSPSYVEVLAIGSLAHSLVLVRTYRVTQEHPQKAATILIQILSRDLLDIIIPSPEVSM